MPKTIRTTVQVRPAMHYIGAGHPKGSGHMADEPQGFEVEFFLSGEFYQRRSYSYSDSDQLLMLLRIHNWVRYGEMRD